MKTSATSDLPAEAATCLTSCSECGTASRVEADLCLRCLLGVGLEQEAGEAENFAALLDGVAPTASEWSMKSYDILDEIGRGGMGVIYRARERVSRRVVALKCILSHHADSADTVERFRREVEATASLDHPNILPIYEVSTAEDGLPFFSMKLAPHGSLTNARLSFVNQERASVQLMAKVARAMQYAHERGILHRDLKPGNILLSETNEPLVCDFGLAKWLGRETNLTRTLIVFGTPGYIAPEQAYGPAAQLTIAADIYSMGAILFELLADRPPFLGEHAWAVLNQAREQTAPRLRSLRRDIDRDLETICARCLEREPSQRYRTAGELAEELERWLAGRPIVARPITPVARLWRWSRRNRVLSSSLAAAVFAIALAVAYHMHSQRLEQRLQQAAFEKHSIAVLPFLDLDEARPDFTSAGIASDTLRQSLEQFGPAKVTMLAEKLSYWTGTGNVSEVRRSAAKSRSRSVLTGTRRRTPTGFRYSMQLDNGETGEMVHDWTFETDEGDAFKDKLASSDASASIYRWLDDSEVTRVSVPRDQPPDNERVRLLIARGRELMNRRNIPDMDRAIDCLESAISEEPKSISAHSYLVFALVGRDYLSAEPKLAKRAEEIAYDSVKLAPTDATANRAVCYVEDSRGNYSVSLDYVFRSIEYGDRSERAFGHLVFIWLMRGRPDLSLRWLNLTRHTSEAAQNDAFVGDCWTALGEDEKARVAYESSAALQPDQADGWIGLCRLRLVADDPNGAREICRRELPKYSQSPIARRMAAAIEFFSRNFGEAEKLYRALDLEDPMGGKKDGYYAALDHRTPLACALAANGHTAQAHQLLLSCLASEEKHLVDVPRDPYSLYRKAAIESMLSEEQKALTDLRAAIETGWLDYRTTRRDPRFDQLSHNPEFGQILADAATKVAAMARAETAKTPFDN